MEATPDVNCDQSAGNQIEQQRLPAPVSGHQSSGKQDTREPGRRVHNAECDDDSCSTQRADGREQERRARGIHEGEFCVALRINLLAVQNALPGVVPELVIFDALARQERVGDGNPAVNDQDYCEERDQRTECCGRIEPLKPRAGRRKRRGLAHRWASGGLCMCQPVLCS